MKYRLFILLYVFAHFGYSQGCSDAGFCTMGAMKPDQQFNRRIAIKLRSIEAAQYIGYTHFGDLIFNYYVDVNIGINAKNTIQIKQPYVIVKGVLDNNQGIGDPSISFTRSLLSTRKHQVSFTLGTKLPLGKTDMKTADGRSLPLYNQAGLGTYDLIFGVSWINKNWMFATGYQQAFGTTDNSFLWRDWTGSELEEKARQYTQSNQLTRAKDVMARVEYNLRFTNWNVNLGLLPIWRLYQDQIKVPVDGVLVDKSLEGSEGLALTLLAGGGYQFNVRSGIKIISGFRIAKREKTPDGLSRLMVTNIGYVHRF